MKKIIALGLIAASAGSAQAVDLFNNGAAASGTPPISVIRTGGTLFGAGAQGNIPNLVADDFTVTGPGWTVESLSFFSYQTGAASAFTFTGLTWSVVAGDVNTGTVVASGSGAPANGGLAGYRVTATTLTDTNRAIFRLDLNVADFNLAPGNYWLRWGITGTLASGPWQPPTADGAFGNASQSLANAPFTSVVDAGDGLGVEFPFIVQGSLVPEPGTWALMLAGGLAVVGLARRRKA
ncbi:PEP-CTERM sorting domain-containing protein [Rubrivivax rivuli]|uniref:PEP-CTERM sorting domain-containing protein n=1 Tax=Rubrivivax rivuli TaxID=1862385 RepID=A0A437RLW0_9BURK|nr:PEP-CTERM sorting domain-containing protein [Rubrivivax rivuli]RVU47759.1 PEP-CTERM sorting domain-containing protein [Rubrivivax rivuli]